MVDSISKALDIEMIEDATPRPDNRYLTIVEQSSRERDLTQDMKDDYELVRNTLRFVIKNGSQALKRITDIAEEKDEALPFDTVARLTKAVVDSTKELKELHTDVANSKSVVKEIAASTGTTNNIDKAVFIGTPNDMLKQRGVK